MKKIIILLFINFLYVFSIRKNFISRFVNNKSSKKILQFCHDNTNINAIKKAENYEIGRVMLMAYYKDIYNIKKMYLKPSTKNNNILNGMLEYEELFKENELSKEILKKQLIVKMAGQAAITIYFGQKYSELVITPDYKEAEKLAKNIITKYNLINSDAYYYLYYNEFFENKLMEEKTSNEITNRISKRIVKDAYLEAIQILLFHKEKMDVLVNELKNKREIDSEIIYIYMNNDEIKSELDREF